jgi:hypothetical protein
MRIIVASSAGNLSSSEKIRAATPSKSNNIPTTITNIFILDCGLFIFFFFCDVLTEKIANLVKLKVYQ